MTIDDGPSLHRLHKLSVLREMGIPAVFFSEGRWLEARPEIALQTIKSGFVVGNHGFGHRHFSDLSLDDCCSEIARTDSLIHSLYCEANQPKHPRFFRFPYGDKGDGRYGRVFSKWKKADEKRHRYLQDFLKELGYQPPALPGLSHRFYQNAGLQKDVDWHWTFDVMEWAVFQKKPPQGLSSLEKILRRLHSTRPTDTRGHLWWSKRWLGNPVSSEIILMHDHEESGGLFRPLLEALVLLPIEFKAIWNGAGEQGQTSA
ncbi:MAG: polysaccharide deacetylase family protein [Saprospiraceae bacterium]|nr:polysaccharide deacetylase family protein [Saprospiraceae bacterium]